MFRIRPLAPVLAAGFALCSGCAQLEWRQANVADGVRDRDLAACMAQARVEALRRMPALQPPVPQITVDRQGRAVATSPPGHDDGRFLAEQDLVRACMRGLGYSLQDRNAP